jgi:hypothetical protein
MLTKSKPLCRPQKVATVVGVYQDLCVHLPACKSPCCRPEMHHKYSQWVEQCSLKRQIQGLSPEAQGRKLWEDGGWAELHSPRTVGVHLQKLKSRQGGTACPPSNSDFQPQNADRMHSGFGLVLCGVSFVGLHTCRQTPPALFALVILEIGSHFLLEASLDHDPSISCFLQ